MTAALDTLVFLATLWLLVVMGASVLEESGAKIVAALKGKPIGRALSDPVAARIRIRRGLSQPIRSSERMRAAA